MTYLGDLDALTPIEQEAEAHILACSQCRTGHVLCDEGERLVMDVVEVLR